MGELAVQIQPVADIAEVLRKHRVSDGALSWRLSFASWRPGRQACVSRERRGAHRSVVLRRSPPQSRTPVFGKAPPDIGLCSQPSKSAPQTAIWPARSANRDRPTPRGAQPGFRRFPPPNRLSRFHLGVSHSRSNRTGIAARAVGLASQARCCLEIVWKNDAVRSFRTRQGSGVRWDHQSVGRHCTLRLLPRTQ
jgi:hypothetical protein